MRNLDYKPTGSYLKLIYILLNNWKKWKTTNYLMFVFRQKTADGGSVMLVWLRTVKWPLPVVWQILPLPRLLLMSILRNLSTNYIQTLVMVSKIFVVNHNCYNIVFQASTKSSVLQEILDQLPHFIGQLIKFF